MTKNTHDPANGHRPAENRTRPRQLFEGLTDVCFALDSELRFTFWNPASEELLGIPEEAAIGQSWPDLFPLDTECGKTAAEALRRVLRNRTTERFLLRGTAEDYLGKASIVGGALDMEREELDLRQDIIDAVLEELADEITWQEMVIDNRLGAIPAGSIAISANKTWLKAVYRFGRIGSSAGPTPDGVGLGLCLCREIILDHCGEIWYEARPDGSNFVFTISRENAGKA